MMDFSEKDAARSKYKLTRKNQRGRGRGRGWAAAGGKSRHTTDLGSNLDRYEEDEYIEEYSEGAVRQSQGADITDWLEQFPPQDPIFHARQRVNLNEDVGLPPADADSFQGLSFDLEGLVACLKALPLHEVLKLPPPLDSSTKGGITDLLDDTPNVPVQLSKPLENSPLDGEPSNQPPAIEKKKIESLYEAKAVENNKVPSIGKAPRASPTAAPAIPPARDNSEDPRTRISVSEEDDELDALLGLGTISGPPPVGQSGNAAGEGKSLEAWLDSL